MPETETLVAVKLKPGQEDRLRAGHLWVFSNEIAQVEGAASPGSPLISTTIVAQAGAREG